VRNSPRKTKNSQKSACCVNVLWKITPKLTFEKLQTLHEESAAREANKLILAATRIPALFQQQTQHEVLAALSLYLSEYLHCEQCWVLISDTRRGGGELMAHSGGGRDALLVSHQDAGAARCVCVCVCVCVRVCACACVCAAS